VNKTTQMSFVALTMLDQSLVPRAILPFESPTGCAKN
jgi:hypothetical protein